MITRHLPSLLLVFLLAFGCSSDGGGDGGSGPESSALDGVTLSTTTPRSLDRVELRGLPPARRAGGSVTVEFVGVEDTRPMPVEFDGDVAYFLAPFHPVTPTDGGEIGLQVVIGEARSPEFIVDLAALEDAPGAFEALVASLRAHVDGFAQRRGSSFEDLQSRTFEETPPALFPLKYAQSWVDDPANPNDLEALAEGSSDLLTADERRFLDQISGVTGLGGLIGLETDGLGDLDPPTLVFGDASPLGRRECIDSGPDISTAAQLSAAMWEAKFAEIAITGDRATTLSALSATLAAGSAIPVYGRAFLAAGGATAAWQASRGALAGMNPSRFVSIDAAASPQRFEEDFEAIGRWSNVRVVAASTGWAVDQAIVDAVVTALGAYASAGQAAQLTAADFLSNAAVSVVNQSASTYVGAQEGGVVEFCPQQWSVDISTSTWSDARSVLGHFEVDSAAQTYRPLEVEADALSIRAIPSKFGQESIDVDIAIGVDPIVVTAAPGRIQVGEPGEIVSITAAIENAVNTSLFWDPGVGTWDDAQGEPTNDGGTRPLRTPQEEGAYPFDVAIESLSRSGLRADNQPVRQAAVRIVLDDEIVVSPANACLDPSESEEFSTTHADRPAAVTWSLEDLDGNPSSFGFVTQQGVYTAPSSGTGQVIVVATQVGDATNRGQAVVEVGSCSCFWALSIAGGSSYSGRFAGHGFPADFGFFTFSFETDSGNAVGNAQSFSDPVPANATGSFTIDTFGFQSGTRSWVVTADPDDGTSATISIIENDGVTMQGSVFGTCVSFLNGEEQFGSFDLNFRSGNLASGDVICGDQ